MDEPLRLLWQLHPVEIFRRVGARPLVLGEPARKIDWKELLFQWESF